MTDPRDSQGELPDARGRQAIQSLRQSEATYRELVENANSIMLRMDCEGRITFVNQFGERFFGYRREELLGRPVVGTIVPAVDASGHDLARMIYDLCTDPSRYINNENENIRRDGTRVWVSWTNKPLLDEQGRTREILCIGNDNTQRRRAEEALKASQQQFEAITQSALDAVVMMDHEGRVVLWNPAAQRMFGYREEEIRGRRAHETLIPPRLVAAAAQGMRQFADTGQGPVIGRVVEVQALRKDGSEFPAELAVSAIRMANRHWAVAVVRDITERKRAVEALRKEESRLRLALELHERERQLISLEIHDGFTQECAAASMQLQAFRDTYQRDPQIARERFEAGMRLLSEAMAESRRLINGLRPPLLEDEGVVPALERLIAEFQAAGGPPIEFAAEVRFDRLARPLESSIYRIVQESLNNARRHSRSDRLAVRLFEEAAQVRIEVRDWGIGFDPDRVTQGHFGLEGIRERAQALGGQAIISSRPGVGTNILVTLPLLERRDNNTSTLTHGADDEAPAAP